MRIVLGVDHAGRWKSASDLLARLRFAEGVVDTVSVVEPMAFNPGETLKTLPHPHRENQESTGHQLACEAAAHLSREGVISGATHVSHGSAATGIMKYADQVRARLIAVGSSGKTALRSFFVGSVGRGLVIGAHQSVLIARSPAPPTGPVRAVLATDHSAYANSCLETLLGLWPEGISHLTVVMAYPKDTLEALRPFLPDFVLDPAQWIEEGLEKRNQEVMSRLKPLGCTLESVVRAGDVHAAIHAAMEASNANLLILGAQGHGFVDRLTLGSVSFFEAIGEPHSVLILRA